MEKMIRLIHPRMEDILVKINNGLSCRQIISEHIMDCNKSLDKAVRARNISPSNKKIQHWILHNLEAYLDKCTNEGRDNKTLYCYFAELLQQSAPWRKQRYTAVYEWSEIRF